MSASDIWIDIKIRQRFTKKIFKATGGIGFIDTLMQKQRELTGLVSSLSGRPLLECYSPFAAQHFKKYGKGILRHRKMTEQYKEVQVAEGN